MNILLLIDRYKPNPISGARMIEDLANFFVSKNLAVTVLSTDHKIKKKYEIYMDGSIRVIKVKTGKINHDSKILRTFIESSISKKIWKATHDLFVNKKLDLIVCYSPTIFWSKLINKIKETSSPKVYLVLRDLFPHWLLSANMISKYNPIYYYFLYAEKKLLEVADRIGVQSQTNLDFYKKEKEFLKFEVLYNWIFPEINYLNKISSKYEKLIEGKFVFIYGGNLGIAQDIQNILRLAKNFIYYKNVIFLIIGNGSEYIKIKNEIHNCKLHNVKLIKALNNHEYQSLLSKSDIGLVSLHKDLRTENFPGKILEYMKYSLPILASVNMGNKFDELIHNNEAGYVSLNGNDDKFFKNALKLYEDRPTRLNISLMSKKLLDKLFHVNVAASKILKLLENN